ncbi:hypothetical protein B0H10DRAFT_1991388 [Mycena sp. CBHHK59/15]|nr:hypothetical protein B0H10DRAFT_1991388 [Mycena sp. CBHHK59/15]
MNFEYQSRGTPHLYLFQTEVAQNPTPLSPAAPLQNRWFWLYIFVVIHWADNSRTTNTDVVELTEWP